MIHLEMSTMIYKPIQQVFDYISTPENDVQWQYGTLATVKLHKDVDKIGTFFRSIGHLMGHRVQSTFEVIQYEPHSEYGFKSLSGPLHLQTSYTFKTADGGTRITISTRTHVVNFFQMDERLLGSKIKKQLKENLTVLKSLLEEQVSGIATHPLAV
jgi:uncharacterized membrane protein